MLLEGKKGLVLNVTNKNSIGWGIAEALVTQGAVIGVGAQNERTRESLDKMVEGDDRYTAFTVDFGSDSELEQLARDVAITYGKIDFVIHSAAYARRDDLAGRFIDTSRDGFSEAMDASAYSLIALCRHLEPLLNDDGSVVALSFLGSVRAASNYNVMGAAKAALESSVRYLAVDLGERGIRVNTLSPGPVNTVAARGVKGLLDKIAHVQQHAPLKRPFTKDEVGTNAVYLVSDLSAGVTGQVIYVDSGYHMVAI